MIKELRLLKNHFAKASTPSLLTKDGTSSVTSDEDKRREDSSVPVLTDDQLGSPPTEEDLRIAISQLSNGKAEDGITAEILRLGGESVVLWLKHLADRVWSEEAVPKDWKKSLLVQLHKKDTKTVCLTIMAFH